jgi:hypothetical protein
MYSLSNNKFKDRYDNHQNNDKNDILKQQCINHIYNSIDISKFKYLPLEFETELPRLLEKKYFVSANFSGSNCLLVFIKIKDKYYQFLIDRKTLSYNSNKINLSQVKITPVNIKLDINIYKERGTIFDGIFITDKNSKTFVITDVYMFRGQDESLTQMDHKLSSVMAYLSSNYNMNDKENTITLTVNKLFEMNQTDDLIKKTIPKIKDFVIKGICFYPEKSGTKLIFMFDNDKRVTNVRNFDQRSNDNQQQKKQYRDSYQNQKENSYQNQKGDSSSEMDDKHKSPSSFTCSPMPTSTIDLSKLQVDGKIVVPVIKKIERDVYVPKHSIPDIEYVFEMQKTDTIDVYNLNIVEIVINDEGKKLYKRIKIGLALVPGMERSIWCQELFEMQTGNILVNCKFHEDKQKWEPIKIAEDAKRPSVVTDFVVLKI